MTSSDQNSSKMVSTDIASPRRLALAGTMMQAQHGQRLTSHPRSVLG